ncbi:MAG: hypothetical protein VYE73_02970 [Acidobacteriota bacterium]|nr:hypothetical protein [Acidobacteriota bacterium]
MNGDDISVFPVSLPVELVPRQEVGAKLDTQQVEHAGSEGRAGAMGADDDECIGIARVV